MKLIKYSLLIIGAMSLIIVFFTGIIALLVIALDHNWDIVSPCIAPCTTLIVGIGGIVSANIIAAKWREQKFFDLEKELIFKIIADINKLQQACIIFHNELEKARTELESANLKDKNLNRLKDIDYDMSSLGGNTEIYFLLNKRKHLAKDSHTMTLITNIESFSAILTIFKSDFLEIYADIHTDKKATLLPRLNLFFNKKINIKKFKINQEISSTAIHACFFLIEDLSNLKEDILKNNQIL